MFSRLCFMIYWLLWREIFLSLDHTLFGACHPKELLWTLKLSIELLLALHFPLLCLIWSHTRLTRCRRRLNRMLLSLLVAFGSLSRAWLLGGCVNPVILYLCRSTTAGSNPLIRWGIDPATSVCLCWMPGWLASSRRDRCPRSAELRRWGSGNRRGRWRVWLRCREPSPYCW